MHPPGGISVHVAPLTHSVGAMGYPSALPSTQMLAVLEPVEHPEKHARGDQLTPLSDDTSTAPRHPLPVGLVTLTPTRLDAG